MFLFTTKGRSPVRGNSDRMREAGGAGTKELSNTVQGVVPTPPGIVMVAPPEAPRNAEGAQRRPRCRTTEVGNNATNNTSIIKAGAPAFGCTVHLLRLQAPRAAYAHKSPGQQQV